MLSVLMTFHSNNVLAQSSQGSNSDLSLIPSDDLIDDDIEIIIEMINQKWEVEEPEELETKLITNGNNDNDDSAAVE